MNLLIQELSARQVPVSNPYVLGPYAAGSTAVVFAESNALFTQRVTITGPPAVCTLQGSGEGVDMSVPASNPTSTECAFRPATTADPLPLSLLFQFSSTGPGGTFVNAPTIKSSTHTNANVVSIVATSEDSTDNDNNDTELNIMVTLFPTGLAPAQSVTSAFGRSLVESGLLFNPTDSITLSVGPFAGDSTLSDFQATTQDWNKVTGEITDVHEDAPFSNLLVMRFLFSDSTNDELKNSSLLLSGVARYVRAGSFFCRPNANEMFHWQTGARPTGTPTRVNWFSQVVTEQTD
jgi:hypothetical protein